LSRRPRQGATKRSDPQTTRPRTTRAQPPSPFSADVDRVALPPDLAVVAHLPDRVVESGAVSKRRGAALGASSFVMTAMAAASEALIVRCEKMIFMGGRLLLGAKFGAIADAAAGVPDGIIDGESSLSVPMARPILPGSTSPKPVGAGPLSSRASRSPARC
jgi:hypothetical protein